MFYKQEKQIEQSIGLSQSIFVRYPPRQREKIKTLVKGLVKDIQHTLQLPKTLDGNRTFSAKKLALSLAKSKLSLNDCRKLLRKINLILRQFKLNPNTLLDISPSLLRSLPATLKRFIISLMVLKAELLNVRKIQLDFEKRIRLEREIENMNRDASVNIGMRNIPRDIGMARYKNYSTAVGLSYGDYIGPLWSSRRQKTYKKHTKNEVRDFNNNTSYEDKKTFYKAWDRLKHQYDKEY